MTDPLEPLDPEIDALLDAERGAEFPRASTDRVWSKLAAFPLVPPAAQPAHGALRAWIASHAVSVIASTFVLGVVSGLGIERATTRPPLPQVEARPAPVASASAVPPAIASIAVVEVAEAQAPVTPAPTSSGSVVHAAPSSSSLSSSFAAERALIDEARTALSQGDAQHALSLLDAHARRFARPRLGEEREALAVQALVALGRADEARRRAAALRSVSPNSLFLPVVDRALESIP